jgi:hypothetical protein
MLLCNWEEGIAMLGGYQKKQSLRGVKKDLNCLTAFIHV